MSNNAHPKAPPKGLIKGLSYFGLLILIAFPLGMLFIGFSTLEVNCTRKQAGEPPDCEIEEARWFGLFKRRVFVSSVESVGYKTGDVQPGSRVTLGSTVVLTGSNGSFPISQAMSNIGSGWKSEVINKVDRFLKMTNERSLVLHIDERNIFGWIGVAFLAFIVFSYIYWFVQKLTKRT